MIKCHYCGRTIVDEGTSSVDSDGGTRCVDHPEARDKLSKLEDEFNVVERRRAELSNELVSLEAKGRSTLRAVVAATLEYQKTLVLRPSEWEACPWVNVRVLDPDGWRAHSELGPKSWDEPIGYDEFEKRLMTSTIGPRT